MFLIKYLIFYHPPLNLLRYIEVVFSSYKFSHTGVSGSAPVWENSFQPGYLTQRLYNHNPATNTKGNSIAPQRAGVSSRFSSGKDLVGVEPGTSF